MSFSSLLSHLTRSSKSQENHSMIMKPKTCPPVNDLSNKTLIFDVEGGLLRSSSTFPYFMLVALEGGSFLRGLLLLLLYPLLCCLSQEMKIKAMTMISFCGLEEDKFLAGRAVLPKFLLEDVGLEGFEVMKRGKMRVCVSRMPRVMVECFLKEYLEAEVVVGRELKVVNGFYTGFMMEEEMDCCKVSVEQINGDCFIGVLSSSKSLLQRSRFSLCKEIYLVTEQEKQKWHPLPRQKYPQPLIFHDGRIAFTPTPLNTTFMFLWLPIALPLSLLRITIGILLPYKLSTLILSLTSTKYRLKKPLPKSLIQSKDKAHLFVCNHRTLIDPIYASIALNKPVTAATYSLSRISEILSPIRTFRLTRNREIDANAMEKCLQQGKNVVVCPEGTTCREPYLLRFSPLFAELTDEVVPVAIDVRVSMFYATTAGGFKGFDAFYYMMNPTMCYELEFLEKVDTKGKSSVEVANLVQGLIGEALGFECTKFSRKDKYMLLAGNTGIVVANEKEKKKLVKQKGG